MIDDRELFERAVGRFAPPERSFERLVTRRDRKHRNKRITAGVLALVVAAAGTSALIRAFATGPMPADPPSVDLGIFEPVAGRIVYYTNSSLWGVDPNAPSPDSTLVRIDLEGTATPEELASFTMPLGWSSDGTKLLFVREDPSDQTFPYDRHLYILHADGTQTQMIAEPVGEAAISPDGSRVVFAYDGSPEGLYVVDADGGQPVRIADVGESPTFSPDGTQIAYLSESGQAGIEHVWVADADGTDAREILTDEALAMGMSGLTWSPAGDRLAIENQLEGRVAIYTFAPDGSDFTEVITGGFRANWSPDGSQIAYGLPGRDGLSIADADGSNVRTFGFAAPGPWHPGASEGEGEDVLDPTPNRFVGGWAATDYNNSGGLGATPTQTMTIRAGEDGVLHITIHDDAACIPDATELAMTGTGRLEDPTTLVVAPHLTCVEGSVEGGDRVEVLDGYTLVLDPATDRLYDNLGVVWNRGAPAESWTGASTQAGVDGPGTYSILHGEVTFRAAEPWNDHLESYIDPRTFFLVGADDVDAEGAEMTLLVNALPPEAPCDRRVPPSAEELVQAVRSNPDLEATAPVIERVGGIDALRMDVVAAPGASFGPCTADVSVDVVSVPGQPWANVGLGELGRLYVLDLPGGSARTLAILITAPDAAVFEQALDAAAPVLDSFEFHSP